MINADDPTYPTTFESSGPFGPEKNTLNGLTIRSHFAAMAMQGYLASISDPNMYNYLKSEALTNGLTPKQFVARETVQMADALIQALNVEVPK